MRAQGEIGDCVVGPRTEQRTRISSPISTIEALILPARRRSLWLCFVRRLARVVIALASPSGSDSDSSSASRSTCCVLLRFNARIGGKSVDSPALPRSTLADMLMGTKSPAS